MEMKNKSQVAMNLLMTYDWAIMAAMLSMDNQRRN